MNSDRTITDAKMRCNIVAARRSSHFTRALTAMPRFTLTLFFFSVLLLSLAGSARAQTEQILYSFTGAADGNDPFRSGVIQDAQGNLYGTTSLGGNYGWGTVYRVRPGGGEDVLYSFTGGADGSRPYASLIQDTNGNLYGTTDGGGTYNRGTVFRVSARGGEKVLYSFTGGVDGSEPYASLVRDTQGNLYGITAYGGAYDWGTVFRVSLSGSQKVLYSFTGGADGGRPVAALIQDTKGNFYSTTQQGGDYGLGTVFRVSLNGSETVLYSFTGGADGAYPAVGLVQDMQGNFYGTTFEGGNYGKGTAFKIISNGSFNTLYTFTGADGAYPDATLIQDALGQQGSLYGTTTLGGAY